MKSQVRLKSAYSTPFFPYRCTTVTGPISPNASLTGLAQIRVTRSSLGVVNAKRTVRHSLSFEAIISAHDGGGLWRGGARQRLLDFSYLMIAIVCEMPGGALADPGDSWNETQFEDVGGPAWGLPCYEEGFAYEIDHFVKRCLCNGEARLSTLEDAVDAQTVLATTESSAVGPLA